VLEGFDDERTRLVVGDLLGLLRPMRAFLHVIKWCKHPAGFVLRGSATKYTPCLL
jgi:hypothetical protein